MTSPLPNAVAEMIDANVPAPAVAILIVNDVPAQRLALKSVLLPLGHEIVEAESGVDALRCVMEREFAVILLDVCMPGMDGFETAALIRQREESEMTPLIFITAYGSDEIPQSDLYAEGAVDFIFAPVPPDELRAKVSVFANLFIRAPAARGPSARGAGVGRRVLAADRRRADRHLPDGRREPLRVHEPEVERDHRDPTRGRGGSRLGFDERAENIRRPGRRRCGHGHRGRAQPSHRDRGPRIDPADRSRDLQGRPCSRRWQRGLGRDPRRHHGRGRRRSGDVRCPRQGHGGIAAEVGLPGQHEPRDPHPDERRHRHDRPAARDRSRCPPARLRADGAELG